METSEEIGELVTALAIAQGNIEGAKKDVDNPFLKSKYADLQSVWTVARKPLSDNGLSVVQAPENVENGVLLRTTLFHSSGQWIASTLNLPVTKEDPQGYGSAISYARRYSLAAMVGVYSEDDDGNAGKKDKDPNYTSVDGAEKKILGMKDIKKLEKLCGEYREGYVSGQSGWTKKGWKSVCDAMAAMKGKLDGGENKPPEKPETKDLKEALKPKETQKAKPATWAEKLKSTVDLPEYKTVCQSLLKSGEIMAAGLRATDEETAERVFNLLEKTKGFEDADKTETQPEDIESHF